MWEGDLLLCTFAIGAEEGPQEGPRDWPRDEHGSGLTAPSSDLLVSLAPLGRAVVGTVAVSVVEPLLAGGANDSARGGAKDSFLAAGV
mmetsp:Transcript_19697/g.46097  ORF Transcript_19697/g.46097 Transcript_19697/m.46097 type:complete len:88 (-) Transcript_19697:10-273(-)